MKNLKLLFIGSLMLGLCACSPAPAPGSATSALTSGDGGACVAEGQLCDSGDSNFTCCAGFCSQIGYAGWGHCTAPLADGAYCMNATECQSGYCNAAERCETPCCVKDSCQTDSDCCDGTYCNNFTYAPPTCHARSASGAFCGRDSECASGHCTNYACAR